MLFKRMFFFYCIYLCATRGNAQPVFAKGADVSWLPQMEASGYIFRDTNGAPANCLEILKSLGMNTIRLRVFVNPSDDPISGHCSKKETIDMAIRAKRLGMRLMIDFHYSDSWADPGKQFKPKDWENHRFPQLLQDVFDHAYDVLSDLKTAGIVPEWVQIGNEIPGGFLWPDGSTAHWVQLGQLLNKGYEAVKKADPSIKVIIHLDEGNNKAKFNSFFDSAQKQQVQYDVIGLSYYPYWIKKDHSETIEDLRQNMNDLVHKFGKEVMVVETGGEAIKVEDTYLLLKGTIDAVRSVPAHKGLGVLYWEPEGFQRWSKYALHAWQENGRPSPALNAFRE